MRTGVRAAAVWATWARLVRWVVPVSCAGCRMPEVVLCPDCRSLFARPAWRVDQTAVPVPVWVVARYERGTAAVVRSFKDGGRLELARVLGQALAVSLRAALDDASGSVPAGWLPAASESAGSAAGSVLVVPVPSRRRAVWRRGEDVLATVARTAARGALPVRVVSALRVRRALQDQAGLGVEQRRRNVAGAFAVRPTVAVAGRRCVVVDDVVTTGASAAEAVRALQQAGASVLAVAAVCATPRRRRVSPAWPLD